MADIRLLGFSIRVSLNTQRSDWSPTRRASHLLHPGVVSPASFDEASWPSPNESDACLKKCIAQFTGEIDLSGNGLNLMEFIPLSWLGEFRCGGDLMLTCTLVAITSSQLSAKNIMKQYGPLVAPTLEEPALKAIREKWHFLGYDVIDFDGVSRLTNCGIGDHWPSQWPIEFRDLLKADLNNFGLLDTENIAQEFSSHCDEDLSDHSPTLYVGLWVNEPATRSNNNLRGQARNKK